MNQSVQNSFLFVIPALIWGSTWYVIKFQLGYVNPIMSVSYRFFLSGVILLTYCLFAKKNLRYSAQSHLLFLLQGSTLFGLNYWLVYMAEEYLTSGLLAVIFSLIVFTNMLFSALILRSKITWKIMTGGILAISGTALIFKSEFIGIESGNRIGGALLMGFISLVLASLGNIISAYNQKRSLPVVQSNTFGMLYGSLLLFVIGVAKGSSINFDFQVPYVLSMMYLALFGSVIAFTAYLNLLGKIGPSKASYVVVIVPIIAMVFSTVFESYVWQKSTWIGMPVLIVGNLIAMNKLKPEKVFAKWKS